MKYFFILLFITGVTRTYSQHVVVVSIDGFRPEMYAPQPSGQGGTSSEGGAGDWPTPNLQWLMKNGVYADHMKSVFPSYTYPSHTAMLTGALPARSGIVLNVKDDQGNWYWVTKDIKTKTLWQAMKENKMTSAAVEWPVSVSSDITYNIPEIWNAKSPEDRVSEVRKYATPGLIEEIEKNATGKLDASNMRDECFCLDENSGRIAAYIFKTYKPNLLCVHFAEVDGMEHDYGTNADSVRFAVATVDHAIGDLLQAIEESGLKDSTTIIIVGDHGFSDIHTVLRPNILLQGIDAKFKSSGGSAFLYKSTVDGQQSTEKIISEVKGKLNALPKDQRNLFRIIDRKELDKMGADSAALLALSAVPGVVFSAVVPSNAGPGTTIQQNNLWQFQSATHGGHHGYDPNIPEMYTGFIAYGAGIKKHSTIKELCVTDIAPLIAKLLHIQFDCPDGKLIPGIISDSSHP